MKAQPMPGSKYNFSVRGEMSFPGFCTRSDGGSLRPTRCRCFMIGLVESKQKYCKIIPLPELKATEFTCYNLSLNGIVYCPVVWASGKIQS